MLEKKYMGDRSGAHSAFKIQQEETEQPWSKNN